MDLDNLKEAWAALDNRLKRNEELKESIILEMMRSKANKLVNRFITFEVISVVVLLFFIPLCVFMLERLWENNLKGSIMSITVFFGGVFCLLCSLWGMYKIYGLMKFDLSKNVGNNIYCVNRYNLQIKREKKFSMCFLIPTIVILTVLSYASGNVSLYLWTFLICALTGGIMVSFFTYKKYDKDIDSILKSLDEIRELKEE